MKDLVIGGRPVKQIKGSVLLAWLLCLFCLIGIAVQLVLRLGIQSGPSSLFDFVQTFGPGLTAVTFSILAALIIAHQPDNRVGWLLMLVALAFALSPEVLLIRASPRAALTPARWLLLWLADWWWMAQIFPILLIPLHFPTGRPPSRAWNWVNWLALGMWLLMMGLSAVKKTIGYAEWELPNPIGFSSILDSEIFAPFWFLGLIIVVSGSVISLFVRYRRAGSVERQQVKWLLYVGALFLVVYVAILILSSGSFSVAGWLDLLFWLLVLAFPVAITMAILRYRLFEIDIIIRKTLVYGLLTVLMAMIYFGSVVVLQNLFTAITGQGSAVAIVISTLAIAALFNPLRRRVQSWIDRRFYRGKYDAAGILAAFAQTARDEVDLENLNRAILGVIESTVRPEQATLWLRPVNKAMARSPEDSLSGKGPVISPSRQQKDS